MSLIEALVASCGITAGFIAFASVPWWIGSPRLLRVFGRVHPAADLCVRLFDMRLGWRESPSGSTFDHEGGVHIHRRYDGNVRSLSFGTAEIPLNAASRAALTLAIRRYKKAQARHAAIRTAADAEAATAAFALRVADMYNPDKVVPFKGRAA
jgi:hypothetical protein